MITRRNRFGCALLIATACFGLPGFSGTARATTNDLREFQHTERQMLKDYRTGRFDKALETANKLHEMRPEDPSVMYNIACLHCLLGQKDKSYDWLEKAVQAGYRDADHMQRDFDLRTIWGEDRFRSIVRRIREQSATTGVEKAESDKSATKENGEAAQDEDRSKADAPRKSAPASDREMIAEIEKLTDQVIHRAERKDYRKALEFAKQAAELAEKLGDARRKALTRYNIACMESRLGNADEAIRLMSESISLGGFRDDMARQMEEDGDLEPLRADARFKELVEKARRLKDDRVEPAFKVVLPKRYDKEHAAPLLVVLHPWGGDMNETAERWKQAADRIGAILLVPQGTFRVADGGYRWDESFANVESQVIEAIDEISRKHMIDESKIIVAGFSQGGWAAFGLARKHPTRIRGALSICGKFDDEFASASRNKALKKLRVVIMIGEEDEQEILESNRAAEKLFKEVGAKVRKLSYENIGHDFPRNLNTELAKALDFLLEE